MERLTFLSIPNYGAIHPETMMSILHASKKPFHVFSHTSSLLVDSFNTCWATMLNTPSVTHFAMIHADIGADPYWVDILALEMEKRNLDVLSVVIPIKDDSGDTSTAMLLPGDKVHRLSLHEMKDLPPTFDTADIMTRTPHQGILLVNTGLWLARKGEWMESFDGFRASSQIIKKEDGTYDTINSPEDWDMSVVFHQLGLRVGATTLVGARHYGLRAWPNY